MNEKNEKSWGFSGYLEVTPDAPARTELDAREWLTSEYPKVREHGDFVKFTMDTTQVANMLESFAASRLAAAEQRITELEANQLDDGKKLYLSLARSVIARILEAPANCEPEHDVRLRLEAIIRAKEAAEQRIAELEAHNKALLEFNTKVSETELFDRVERAEAALAEARTYLQHRVGCNLANPASLANCTCGLDDVLTRLGGER